MSIERMKSGYLNLIDSLPTGDDRVGNAIETYGSAVDINRQSRQWVRAVQWIENILFSMGRHYIDDMMVSRLSRDTNDTLSVVRDATRSIPRPVNDMIGRYVETNIALLTENRPRPRVTSKSDATEDQDAAELSELTLEYLWEALDMPEKHRELARIILHCGVAWMEVAWDDVTPRRLSAGATEKTNQSLIPGLPGTPPVAIPINRVTGLPDPFQGAGPKENLMEYGDVSARVISPFEMHLPSVHTWNGEEMGWVMREWYSPKEVLIDKYSIGRNKASLTRKEGWFLDNLNKAGTMNIQNLPLWWWERLTDLVEGPGPSLYVGTPELWDGYTVCRIFDRKPSPTWPNGRTVITAGNQVIYDSPKDKGGRAFNPKWPTRWHPYTRYRWEGVLGSIYGRSLVSKLLPKIKRVNAIDTALIMWRRTIPIATWVVPKGACVVEDNFCLPGNAKILCVGKSKSIRDIVPGDKVYSNGQIAKVEEVYNNGLRDTFSIIRSLYNSEFKITPNHKIPVYSKGKVYEKEAQNITTEDYMVLWTKRPRTESIVLDLVKYLDIEEIRTKEGTRLRKYLKPSRGMPSTVHTSGKLVITDDLLWLFGLYAAEGSTSKNQMTLSLGSHEDVIAEKAKKIIFNTWGVTATINKYEDRGTQIVVVSNSILASLFRTLIPGTSKIKYLDAKLFNLDMSLLPLIAGWMDGDGTYGIYKNRIAFGGTSASISLAMQMRQIALDEGICAAMYKTQKAYIVNFLGCGTKISDLSVRFVGKSASTGKHKDQAFTDGDFWYFKVRSNKIKVQKESETVYDLKTTTGYFNYRGMVVHNSGRPGQIWEYDPRRTAQAAPQPVNPPPFPEAALKEREIQLAEMEFISGTEQLLRGQRPTGVNSAAMLDVLRKQALASRSAILQAWDEAIQEVGTSLLQETISHVRTDPRYAERIRILAREKSSRLTIEEFSGADLSDNVIVRVDTASLALVSKEAREAKVLEFLQYAPSLMQLPLQLRQAIVEELGFKKTLTPQGPDVERAKRMLSWIRTQHFERVVPMPEDDPQVFFEIFSNAAKADEFWDYNEQQQKALLFALDTYRMQLMLKQQQLMQMQMMLGGKGPQGGGAPPGSAGDQGGGQIPGGQV